MKCLLHLFFFLIILGLFQTGCDRIPEEGTIVYDVDFPRADSDEAQGGGGGGAPPGGPVTPTNPNGSGASYTVSKTIANVYENHSDNDSFTLVLGKAPTADVYMGIANPDTTEVSVSPTSVVFGTGNWSTAQTISLIGVEDGIVDGNLATNLTVYIDNSSDSDYNTGIDNATVAVNSIDSSSISAITLTTTGGNSVTESSGTTDTFTVALATRPAQNVTVTLTSADTGEVTVTPSSVVFGTGNFSSAQTITLTAVEDNLADGDQTINVSANATSTDISYNAISSSISVTVVDSGNAPPAAIPDLRAVGGTQLNTITWSKPTGTTSYTLYWSTSSPVTTGSGNFTISSGDTLTYTHAGLTAGTAYYYAIAANNTYGAAALSNEVSGTPTAYSGPPVCNTTGTLTDNDTDLLVHYAFSNNLNDIAGSGTTGSPYNLSNTGGTIKYAQSCAYGQAAYFDSSTGYLENSNFNRTNIASLDSGNYTIALWVNRDADMIEYASAISSKDTTNSVSTWGDSIQIDVDEIGGNNYMRWNNAPSTGISDQAMITDGTSLTDWSYITAVHYDNNTAQFYRNGVLVGTHTTFPARWYKMKVGINRGGYVGNLGSAWKGYIDEVKVYNRAFDGDDVKNACLLYNNCTGLTPAKPDNLTATAASSSQINLSWNPVNGVTNYTIEWGTSSGSYTGGTINTANTTYPHTGRSASTAYYYRVKANNSTGSSAYTSEATATTTVAVGITLSSTAISITESGRRGDADWWIQEGDTDDEKTGGTNFAHNAIDSEMNIIGFGSTYGSYVGSNQGYTDLIVAKFDPSGKRLWNKQIGTNNFDYAHYGGVAVDSNDNIYLYGTRRNASGQPTGGFRRLIKLDKNGTTQWDKYLDSSPSTSYAESTDIIIEGNYIYLTGKDPDRKVEIHKYDFDGNQVASKEITSSFTAISLMASGFTASSSAVYVTVWGNTGGAIASDLIKLPLDLSSQTLLNNATDMQFNEMGLLSNGNVVIVGRDPNSDPYGTPIMRTFNSSGTQLSSGTKNQGNSNRQMNSGYYDDKLVIDSADNIIFLQINSLANNNKESYLVKYDSSGNFINEKKLPKYNGLPTGLDIRKNPEGTDEIISVSATISPNGVYGIDGLYYMYTGGIARYSNNAAPVTSTPGYTEVNFSVDSKPSSHVYVCPSYSSSELVVLPNGDRSFSYLTGYNIYGAYNCIKIFHDPGSKYSTAPIKFFAVQDNVTDGNKDVTVGFTVHSMDLNYNGLTIDNVTVTVIDAAVPSPNAPLHLKATLDNSTGTSNVLSWYKPNMTGLGEGIQNYTIKWNTDNGTSWTSVTGITNTTYTHSGLTAGTTYYYEVFANNQGGAGAVSNRASDTTVPNPPTNLAGTTPANTQQVNLTWTQSLGGSAHSYVIYWKKASGSPISFNPNDNSTYHGKITIDNSSTSSHVHSGLDGATQYNYIIRAETAIGRVSTSEPSSNSYSIVTNSFPSGGTITTDNDPDLMVYYDFNDNGTLNSNLMNKSPITAGSYNLTASGSTIVTAESRFTGNAAAYFDADEGYAYNNDFNDTNITQLSNTGNFTISAWVYPDQDMVKFASIMSTGDSTNKDTGAFQMSNTNNSPNKIGMFAQNKDIKLESSATSNNTWYHAVFVKEQNGTDNGTGRFYLNGVEVDNETNFKTGFKKIKIGINRVTQNSWKGYIDEFKVYRRALDATEVNNVYTRDYP